MRNLRPDGWHLNRDGRHALSLSQVCDPRLESGIREAGLVAAQAHRPRMVAGAKGPSKSLHRFGVCVTCCSILGVAFAGGSGGRRGKFLATETAEEQIGGRADELVSEMYVDCHSEPSFRRFVDDRDGDHGSHGERGYS